MSKDKNSKPDPTPPTDDKDKPVPPAVGDDKSDKTPDPKDTGKVLTQADIDAAVKKAEKEWAKKKQTDEDNAKLSDDERLKSEVETLKAENQMIKAESEVCEALKTAGAKSPKLLFNSSRGDLEFKDGKLTNLTELIADLKISYPEQFGTDKPEAGADGGAGNGDKDKKRAETLSEALKNHYKK
jgi:hypothetical protein